MGVGIVSNNPYANYCVGAGSVIQDAKEQPKNGDASGTEKKESAQTDSIEISQAARHAAQEETVAKAFTERALDLLRVRNISDEDILRFQEIIHRASDVSDSHGFLKSLSLEERDCVKRANSYGIELSDAHIDGMSKEGARNMLVQPDARAYVDFNNDGVVDHGQGKSFIFPPPNAPEKIKDAWDKTMESLPEEERLMASAIFLTQQLCANIKCDENGTPVGVYAPGEEGYTNIFPTSTEEWDTLLDSVDAYLDWAKTVISEPKSLANIEKNEACIALFRENIKES